MGLQHFSDAERDCVLGAPSWQEAPGTQGVWGKPGAQMCHARQVRQVWQVRQVRQCATRRPRAPGEPGAPRATSAPFIAHIDHSARPCRCRERGLHGQDCRPRPGAGAPARGRPLGHFGDSLERSDLDWTNPRSEGSATRRSTGCVAQRARSGQRWACDCAPGARSEPGEGVAPRATWARCATRARRARRDKRAFHRAHRPQRVSSTTVEGNMFAPLWPDCESSRPAAPPCPRP